MGTRAGPRTGRPVVSWRWAPMRPGMKGAQRASSVAASGVQTMAEVVVTEPMRMARVMPAQTPSVRPKSSALTIRDAAPRGAGWA